MKKISTQCFIALVSLFLTSIAFANLPIKMYLTAKQGQGKAIGTIIAQQTPYGVLFVPHLRDLPPGPHGFHLHVNPSCDNFGMAAGGHLDPQNTGKHLGPYNSKGHLGDIAVLIVNANGTATIPVLAPRLKITDLKNHSLMIHVGSDNYSDNPPMGGGGARLACGVIR